METSGPTRRRNKKGLMNEREVHKMIIKSAPTDVPKQAKTGKNIISKVAFRITFWNMCEMNAFINVFRTLYFNKGLMCW